MELITKKLNNIRIGTRLILLMTMLIVVSMIVGIISYTDLKELNRANNSMYNENLLAINEITSFKSDLIENQSSIRAMIISTDMKELNGYKDKIEQNIKEDDQLISAYKKTIISDDERNLMSQMESQLQDYRSVRNQILQYNFNDLKESAQANKLLVESNELYNKVIDTLQQMKTLNINFAKKSQGDTT